MTYLELTRPRKYKYGGFKGQALPKIEIVEEEFVPDNLKTSWEEFKDFKTQIPYMFKTSEELSEPTFDETYIPIEETFEENNFNSPVLPTPKSFMQLLKDEKIDARITSGYRENATTSNGSRSHHATKDNPAIDIVPTNGKTYDELIIQMITNPRILNYFKDNGWGIHSEVSKDLWNSLTTGAHLHIGPDKVAQKGLAKILENYDSGIRVDLWNYNS